MFTTIRSHIRSQWMGALALFLVLAGGGAYAASQIGPKDIKKNAVRAKHIKKDQVRTKHIQARAVTGAKLAEGVEGLQGDPGPPGPQGEPATRLWAVVNADTTTPSIRRQSGAVGLQRRSAGGYDVRFNRSVRDCAPSAVIAENLGAGDFDRSITAFTSGDSPGNVDDDEVFVFTSKPPSTGTDTDFSVQVFC